MCDLKNKRIQNNLDICEVCKKKIFYGRDKHHIFNGNAYRNKSEKDKLYYYLHHDCHMWIHNNPKELRKLKVKGQKYYEENIGSRAEFIKRYGKNYLED